MEIHRIIIKYFDSISQCSWTTFLGQVDNVNTIHQQFQKIRSGSCASGHWPPEKLKNRNKNDLRPTTTTTTIDFSIALASELDYR